jgi:hypothetical protein
MKKRLAGIAAFFDSVSNHVLQHATRRRLEEDADGRFD